MVCRNTTVKPISWAVPLAALLALTAAIPAPAQTFTTLASFNGTDGASPISAALVQGTDGNFYGTTDDGGSFGFGTAFKLTPTGSLTTLHSFCEASNCADGINPAAGLALGTDGNVYGTTVRGGRSNAGTIFRMTLQGILTTLHNFTGADGSFPETALVQAADGAFYGTASAGANTSACPGTDSGCGTVFKITSQGSFRTLHSFDSIDGATPLGALIQAIDGNLYGTTFKGGPAGLGTVFRISPAGQLTTLHNFEGSDGEFPSGPLLQAANGLFYGTAGFGGAHGNGTVFQITSSGTLTTLHNFDLTDGYVPTGVLVQATDGNFYGVTETGGTGSCGTVFKITSSGALTTLHDFDLADGCNPGGGLAQSTDGSFFALSSGGGADLDGTAFSLDIGLGPFVEAVPGSGKAGEPVTLLGSNLTGATSVSFNGTPAGFTVKSPTIIETAVPPAATTGLIQVVGPSGTLHTSAVFRVVQ